MIKNYTHILTIALIYIACIIPNVTIAQENINTKSGQLLTVLEDGSYTHRASNAESESNDDEFMRKELVALEDPYATEYGNNTREIAVLSNLKTQLQSIEAKNTIDRYNFKVKRDLVKEKLKAAKKAKQKVITNNFQKELDAVEVKYDLANMRAEESYNLIKRVNIAYKEKSDDKELIINEIVDDAAKRLGTDIKPIKSTAVDYTFKVDRQNPEYTAHNQNCNITFSGKDASLNKNRIEHAPQHLFGYTSDNLKHFLKNENFLNCNAYLTKLDDDYYLNLDLDLATKNASKNYGFIDKGDMIKLTFINGENFIANSIYRAEGKLEPYSGHTKYEAVYKLQDIEMELIEGLELDKLAIIWSSGFEEYPIYEIDVLQRQLKCLKKEQ